MTASRNSARRILVTAALPYANGHIHLGHLVEYIQTDIWVRFQRLRGQRVVFVCADDTHGTAIMLRARQEGRATESLIADMREAHVRDFAGFEVNFDHYGSTHSQANRELCGLVWAGLQRAGLIEQRPVTQLYDPQEKLFLADRFVKGTCPRCGAANQYGDSCDKCGATYSATELVDAVSVFSGAKPELRSEEHLFVNTERRHGFLEAWVAEPGRLHDDVANWLRGAFLAEPLRDWDVSRPAPYFGFEIPETDGQQYWYVWFDAPIGYVAATAEWCQAQGERLADWWQNPATEVHHFIGKDITYFHTLFWPVMLEAVGWNQPRSVHVHGFLTVDGEKMSKTKGTFVRAATYLEHLDPAYLRYYYASKLTPRLDNLDLNLEEFAAKVNSDLVGKVVNLASRTARLVEATGLSPRYPDDGGLFQAAAAAGEEIAAAYDGCDYNRAMRAIMQLADAANRFVDEQAPWTLRKDPNRAGELQDACTVALNLYRQLALYLAPVLPRLARQTEQLLHCRLERWEQVAEPLVGTPVAKFEHLLTRVDPQHVAAMVAASREEAAASADKGTPGAGASGSSSGSGTATSGGTSLQGIPKMEHSDPTLPTSTPTPTSTGAAVDGAVVDGPEPLANEPLQPLITIDDFAKVDLRVARIVAAAEVPKAKKLLQLTLSLGGDERRNVFAGIKSAYTPEQLVGRLVICVANLQPRQMTFGVSEGMVVAAGGGGPEVYLLSPDSGALPGQRIH